MKTRLQRWLDGEAAALWAEAVVHGDSLAKRGKKSTSSSSSLNIRRARKATQEGLYNKAIKALTSEELAEYKEIPWVL